MLSTAFQLCVTVSLYIHIAKCVWYINCIELEIDSISIVSSDIGGSGVGSSCKKHMIFAIYRTQFVRG